MAEASRPLNDLTRPDEIAAAIRAEWEKRPGNLEHEKGSQQMSSFEVGSEVEYTYVFRGKVTNTYGGTTITDDNGLTSFVPSERETDIKVINRPVNAGSVWHTKDGIFFARVSRLDIPLRMTPADLSNEGKLKTLPVSDFFEKYPKATKLFDPGNDRLNQKIKNNEALEALRVKLNGKPDYKTPALGEAASYYPATPTINQSVAARGNGRR